MSHTQRVPYATPYFQKTKNPNFFIQSTRLDVSFYDPSKINCNEISVTPEIKFQNGKFWSISVNFQGTYEKQLILVQNF